uniref:SET domain-containing protein n=1 Tax=Elaeophora elaphi TaxID=1147741 RepID=A0A0R3RXR9_9BILA
LNFSKTSIAYYNFIYVSKRCYDFLNFTFFYRKQQKKKIIWYKRSFFSFTEQEHLLSEGKVIFPVRQIKRGDGRVKGQNGEEYFGQQDYGMLNVDIICNYYYRDPTTRDPIFVYSKKLDKKYLIYC